MDLIQTPNKQFIDGDRRTPGTPVPAWFLNQLQNELVAILKKAGIEPDKENHEQVVDALQRIISNRSTAVVDSIESLRKTSGAENQVVTVRGYYSNTPGVGGGLFYASKVQSGQDNGGTIIAGADGVTWYKFDTEITPEDFGARGDGKTDDSDSFLKLEKVITHQTVNLYGKTYKTTKNFTKNRYINGVITTGRNQDYANGAPSDAQSLLGNGAGSLIAMVKTIPDQREGRAVRSILQGATQDPRTGEFWTLQPYSDVDDGVGGTVEASVLIKYGSDIWGADKEIEPVLTSKPTYDVGHQNLAIQYQNGQRFLWATGGNIKKTKRQLYAVRLQVDDTSGEISNVTYYQLFEDGVFNGDGNNCVAVSPDGQWLVATSKYTQSNMWVARVWRITDLGSGSNNDNWVYQIPLKSQGGLPVQAIATDGAFIYVLHGGGVDKNNVYSVFELNGTHVIDYTGDGTGKDKMEALAKSGYNKYYEPEAFVVCNFGGKLLLTQWIILGKKNNHHACAVYAMRPVMGDVHTEPITYLGTAAKAYKEYRLHIESAGSDKKTFTAGHDGNGYSRTWSNGEYIGLTAVNNPATKRKFSVVTCSTGGAITFYNKEDTGGTPENLGVLRLAGAISESYLDIGQAAVYPSHTNKASLGKANKLWTNVYAATAAINTSDRRLKQDITSIPDEVISAWRDVPLIQYRWIDAVREKSVGARYHTGLIAQSISEAFAAHGLDAQDYGLICYDQWPEVQASPPVLDENGMVLEPGVEYQSAGERWGIRAEECLFIEAESNRRQVAELLARIEKLEKAV